jgi:hypothetical protein
MGMLVKQGRAALHDEVDTSKLPDTTVCGTFQALGITDIGCANSNDLGPWASGSNVARHVLGLLDIAAHNAGVGTQMDQGANLSAADGTRTSSAEDHLIRCRYCQLCNSEEVEGHTYRRCRPSIPH